MVRDTEDRIRLPNLDSDRDHNIRAKHFHAKTAEWASYWCFTHNVLHVTRRIYDGDVSPSPGPLSVLSRSSSGTRFRADTSGSFASTTDS